MKNKGILFAALAYSMWGLFPIYFKLLHNVPSVQIVMHRIVWSALLLSGVVVVVRQVGALRRELTFKIWFNYLIAGSLLTVNWLVYVWSVNSGHILDGSMGYFINPLVSVLLGVIFLRERLRTGQWAAIGLAAAGVIYLTVTYGSLPWIALALASTFGLYGLMKKLAPLNPLHGLTLETTAIFLPALGVLIFSEISGVGVLGHTDTSTTLLIIFTGVMTVLPLLLFSASAQMVPLSTLGVLQYISPTLQFLTGVLLYQETFSVQRLIGFVLIWAALGVFTLEGFAWRRRMLAADAARG